MKLKRFLLRYYPPGDNASLSLNVSYWIREAGLSIIACSGRVRACEVRTPVKLTPSPAQTLTYLCAMTYELVE